MLHAGLALELARAIGNDRRAEARVGRGPSEHQSRLHRRHPREVPAVGRALGAPTIDAEDPWSAWRVVEPDAEYLRRRAA